MQKFTISTSSGLGSDYTFHYDPKTELFDVYKDSKLTSPKMNVYGVLYWLVKEDCPGLVATFKESLEKRGM